MAENFNLLQEAVSEVGRQRKSGMASSDLMRIVDSLFQVEYSNNGQPLTIKMRNGALNEDDLVAIAEANKIPVVRSFTGKPFLESGARRSVIEKLKQSFENPDDAGAYLINNPYLSSVFLNRLRTSGESGNRAIADIVARGKTNERR